MPHRSHALAVAGNLAFVTLLAATVPAQFARAQAGYYAAFWNRNPASPGDWFDAANWNPGLPGPLASVTIDNGGTAVISAGHAEALGGWIGFNNAGALRITGGSAVFQWQLALGYMPDARGELHIDGGALNAAGGLLVGAGGRGDVTQTGGDVDAPQLILGSHAHFFPFPHFSTSSAQPEDYGRGHYRLAGGNLQTTFATVGNSGVGRFIQDGGRTEVADTLRVGGQISELPDLTRPPLFIGDLPLDRVTSGPVIMPIDTAPLIPHVGLVTELWFQSLVPSRGLYELNDGELVGGNLLVDRTGTYRQTGGTSDFDFVAIKDQGQSRLRGGELHAEHGFHSDDPVDMNNREVTLSVGAGILDFSNGIAGAKNAHIAAGPDSLTILPAGFNPNTGFGTFNRQGMVHVAGNDLALPAGKRIAGAGVIDDFVTARGEIAATGYGINLSKGLRLQSGANVDLGDGALAAVGRATSFQGGDLSARQLVIGGTLADPWHGQFQNNGYWRFNDPQFADAPGVVRHAAGDVQIAQRATVLSGAYRISGGELDAESIEVGVNQWYGQQEEEVAARFVQTGGTVRTSNLTLSQSYVYPLAFDATHGLPDLQHNGAFEFAAATNDEIRIEPPTDHLTIAPFIGPTAINASYRLEAGELVADRIYLNQTGTTGSTTRVLQTGGSVVSNSRITMYGPDTSYIINGGQLTARRIEIGAQYVLTNPEYVVNDSATFAVRDASSDIEIRGELLLGGGSQFRAVPGTTICMTNPEPAPEGDWQALPASSFRNLSFDSDDLAGLKNLTLVFDGHTNEASTLEVAGLDLGSGPAGYQHNFALAGLTLGGDSPASLQLTDLIDNQRNGDFNEALYVDTLIVGAGSTLDIGGLNLYYRHAEIAGTVLMSGGGMFAANVPEPAAATMVLVGTLVVTATRRRTLRSPQRASKD